MTHVMSSKERILATLARKETDHVPCCFEGLLHGGVTFITRRFPDRFERARYYLSLELDTGVALPLPVSSPENFEVREWEETQPGERHPIRTKEYSTPKGTLTQVVRRTPDYPARINLISDHNVPPTRSKRYLVEREEDLEPLPLILRTAGAEFDEYRREMKEAAAFCGKERILLSGYSQGIGDVLMWFSGVENILLAAVDRPAFLERYVGILEQWCLERTRLMIEAGTELIIRRGWYETAAFWSPALYRRFLAGPLAKEIALCRQAGVILTYVMNSGIAPMLGILKDLRPDILSNLDPALGDDLGRIKAGIGGSVTLCGGVNNFRVLEQGSEEEVDAAVTAAMEQLAPGGGFILAPGDSVMYGADPKWEPVAERNVLRMIQSWKRLRYRY